MVKAIVKIALSAICVALVIGLAVTVLVSFTRKKIEIQGYGVPPTIFYPKEE